MNANYRRTLQEKIGLCEKIEKQNWPHGSRFLQARAFHILLSFQQLTDQFFSVWVRRL